MSIEEVELPMASTFARTLRAFAEREQLDLSQTNLSPVPAAAVAPTPVPIPMPQKVALPKAVGSPLTTGISMTKKSETKPQEQEPEQEQPAKEAVEEKTPAQPMSGGLLIRGLAWLKKNNKFGATKQLRVAETISLGEKRFVSVIHVDGQKFLIGGGSSGVSLLTQLGPAEAAADALKAIANTGEQLK
jgi:flagellar biogenesis protein FliO